MKASVWNNGGSQYGIRVGRINRDQYFDQKWKAIEVELDGRFHRFELTDGFWNHCPEFRDRGQPLIRDWLQKRGLLDWPLGKPHALDLFPLGSGKFQLRNHNAKD